MTFEQKLQFLIDREKDGQSFYNYDEKMQFLEGKLCYLDGLAWKKCNFSINELQECNFGLTKGWEFTAEEKIILKNMDKDFQWIARDENNLLYLYCKKPFKSGYCWTSYGYNSEMSPLEHLFTSVQWADNEPCEFRNYL